MERDNVYQVDASAACAFREPQQRGKRAGKCRKRANGRSTAAGGPCWCACSKSKKVRK